jgi:hypothetical protein
MQFDQTIRRLVQSLRRQLSRLGAAARRVRFRMPRVPRFNLVRPGAILERLGGLFSGLRLRGSLALIGVVVILLVFYYILGAYLSSKVDADLSFAPQAADAPAGASQSIAITAALIEREMPRWVPNDPFYKPTFILHNMPNFQRGMLKAFQRFTIELNDQLGRTRGSSPTDPDLEKAAGDIRYGAERWIWNRDRWWAINLTAEDSYRRAAKALRAYNLRLAQGQATFDARADNLKETLDGMANDLGGTSATIDEYVAQKAGFPWNVEASNLFYRAKGQLYAFYMILKALRTDVAEVLKEKNLEPAYAQMLGSFAAGLKLDPLLVLNGSPDTQFFPNHLVIEGFYLLRARTQLREITSILQA